MAKVTYTTDKRVMVLDVARDPFVICELARSRIFPGVKIEHDPNFEQAKRTQREAKEKGNQ